MFGGVVSAVALEQWFSNILYIVVMSSLLFGVDKQTVTKGQQFCRTYSVVNTDGLI